MGKGDTCDVCGGTETMLVDGFYYCAECGTQDTNVRETVVEQSALADGTFAIATKQKFSIKIHDGVQMPSEWYKWHAWNFIMLGLTEDLLRLGAAPSLKMKVLWIWSHYIKKHQNKEQMFTHDITEIRDKIDDMEPSVNEKEDKKNPRELELTENILVAILILALNLDKSEIHLSHLRRYIHNGQLGVVRSKDYVPKEINIKAIGGWTGSIKSTSRFTREGLGAAMQKCMALDLSPYLVPNLDCMIENHLKELCLPLELKDLVVSLMDYAPVNFLDGVHYAEKTRVLPDFEGVTLSYVLVALKLCLGLDDDYELRLSDAVDRINDEENNLKAYKSDMFCEPSERLFSFRAWCKYIEFRRYMLCKYNSAMALERGMFLDDYVFMENLKDQPKKEVLLSDEVTMDIINRIPYQNDLDVIPMSKFEPSMTPLSTATEVITRHLRDQETVWLLSEDFTQYSINYACKDLALPTCAEETSENIIVGVSTSGKTSNELLGLHFTSSYSDNTMVYVRNCENKNWYKTKRPSVDHIIKVKESLDKDSDLRYDSNIDNTPLESNTTRDSNENQEELIQDSTNTKSTLLIEDTDSRDSNDNEETKDRKLEVFEEEEEGKNIFDDDFLDTDIDETKFVDSIQNLYNETRDDINFEDIYENNEPEDSKVDLESISMIDSNLEAEPEFDPVTFDRELTIKKLVIAACQEYKVPIPAKFKTGEPKKAKLKGPNMEAGLSRPKRHKPNEEIISKRNEKKAQVNEIITAYYSNLERDIVLKVSNQVRSFIDNMEQCNIRNDSIDQNQVMQTENSSAMEINDIDHDNLEQSEIDGNESDDGSVQDPVYKGDPKFDEKTYNTSQLYVKVKGEFDRRDLFDLDSDEEINKLLEEQIKKPVKLAIDRVDSEDDSLDDVPLSRFKKPKRRRNLESLIKNPDSIDTFNYWFKHYLSRTFKKHELVQRFDAEVRDTFPKSFAFVLCECAAVLNCTAYSLYRHMTDIEEKMLQNDGYKRKMKSLKDTGIRIERRDNQIRNERKRRQLMNKRTRVEEG